VTRWILAWVLFIAALSTLFLVVGDVDVGRYLQGKSRLGAAATSVGLLASDIFLPIPSSIVMTFNGSLFSFLPGAGVSVVGLLSGALVGYGFARRYGKGVVRLVVGRREVTSVTDFFERYGLLAVILSRPVPLLAETITCMAGTADMPLGRFLAAQLLGGLPLALGYAWAGDFASRRRNVFLALSIAVMVPSALWTLWALTRRKRERVSPKVDG